ncbi:MAG: N-ethylammeline chlorohydrolase, partial [Thermoproteota archaeon]
DEKFIGVHACKLNDKEISYLGETRSNTVHCPTSNMYIADGVSPVIELANKGVNVCLATDGPASTGRQDFFSEMKTAALLHKVHHEDPAIITAKDVLKMATVNGARALGIKAGVIKEGYLADLIILDMWKVHTVHSYDPIGAVVYSATPENVDTVIVDGRILMEGRRLTLLDEERVLKRGYETAEKLVSGK